MSGPDHDADGDSARPTRSRFRRSTVSSRAPRPHRAAKVPRGERRGPVTAAVLVAMVSPFLISDQIAPGPIWILPVIEGVLLVAMTLADPGRIDRTSTRVRRLRIALISVMAFVAGAATVWLTRDIIEAGPGTNSAGELLRSGSVVWINIIIVFGLLYWEFDSGGPGRRVHHPTPYPDLGFPQQLNPTIAPPGWRPVFIDYLYLGLTGALAFSPTDVMPLARWAKVLMAVESLTSVVILSLVVARAVNILN